MVQSQTFPKRIEQNIERMMPPSARSILYRVARDVARNAKKSGNIEHSLSYGHATLHMKLFQRFGTSTREFMDLAHEELDKLADERQKSLQALPFAIGAAD